jgi:hypothetical protein
VYSGPSTPGQWMDGGSHIPSLWWPGQWLEFLISGEILYDHDSHISNTYLDPPPPSALFLPISPWALNLWTSPWFQHTLESLKKSPTSWLLISFSVPLVLQKKKNTLTSLVFVVWDPYFDPEFQLVLGDSSTSLNTTMLLISWQICLMKLKGPENAWILMFNKNSYLNSCLKKRKRQRKKNGFFS